MSISGGIRGPGIRGNIESYLSRGSSYLADELRSVLAVTFAEMPCNDELAGSFQTDVDVLIASMGQ
jgi:hypothetical protein